MRFQTQGSYHFPTLPLGMLGLKSNGVDAALHWDTATCPSGESGIIIQGGSPTLTVKLSQLLVGWGGLEIAGRIEIQASLSKPLCVLFQTVPSGFLPIPLNDAPFNLGDFGLRCANNSSGGEYSVTAYYYVAEE